MGRKSREKWERREQTGSEPIESERLARIDVLKERARQLAGGDMECAEVLKMPVAQQESYWEDIVAFESKDGTQPSLFEGLEQQGIGLPAPEELTDEEVALKVEEVILALAEIRVFLLGLGAFTDRELYAKLWKETLWEGRYIKRKNPASMTVINLLEEQSGGYVRQFLRGLARHLN